MPYHSSSFFKFLSRLTFVCIFLQQACWSDVIAIIVCDTHAHNIEKAVVMDLNNIRAEAQRIALYTNNDLKELIFDGPALDASKFLKTLHDLEFSEEDIVIFYFSGHGYRTYAKEETIPWPNLFFTFSEKGIDYAQVLDILTSKKKRLLLAIADCCNNYMDDDIAPPVVRKDIQFPSEVIKENYKKLFLETSGDILIASSGVSELSWCYSKGAVFTIAFLDQLRIEAQVSNAPSWKAILEKTASKIRRHQTPIYVIL